MNKYKKAVVAALVFLGVLGTALADWSVTPEEWSALAVAAVGVFGVFQAKNATD